MKKVNWVLLCVFLLSFGAIFVYAERIPRLASDETASYKNSEYIELEGEDGKTKYQLSNGNEIVLYYKESKVDTSQKPLKHYYCDDEMIEYVINAETGELSSVSFEDYIGNNNIDNILTTEDLLTISKEITNNYFSLDDYSLEDIKEYDYGQTRFSWYIVINEIKTSDRIIVNINNNGDIGYIVHNSQKYSKNDIAEMSDLTGIILTREEASKIALSYILENYDDPEYKINDIVLNDAMLYFDTDKKLYWRFLAGITRQFGDLPATCGMTFRVNANTGDCECLND